MPAAKKATKTAVARKPRAKKELVFYVLSERTKLFSWRPVMVFENYDLALQYKKSLEQKSQLSIQGYKIDAVKLVNAPIGG